MKPIVPATLMCDFYKVSHREQYPAGTEVVYSTWTPRSNKHYPEVNEVVCFGIQGFIIKYLIRYFDVHFFYRDKESVIDEYERYIKYALGVENPDSSHIAELHDLGYLPIEIKALPEGTRVPMRVPMMTVRNTDKRFFWLTNYLETLISTECWLPSTSATIADRYKAILTKYAIETTGSDDFVPFQGHDFSMRGMGGLDSAMLSGAGHLLSFVGTDTIPAIAYLEEHYGADIEKELVGCSIPATEHSVMCAGGVDNEFETYERLITEVYPSGMLSIVSDTWDLWKCISDIIVPLKDKIMARDGKIVIRPDSGDPVKIICGTDSDILYINNSDDFFDLFDNIAETEIITIHVNGKYYKVDGERVADFESDYGRHQFALSIDYENIDNMIYCTQMLEEIFPHKGPESKGVVELLWEIFGGTVTEQGYKVLDEHIGVIYGDSITPERCEEICRRLAEKGFASTNMVYGIGSYTYQYNTRDTFGFAMKSTAVVVDGKERHIFKDPITDDGTKKSNTGAVAVQYAGDKFVCVDSLSIDHYENDCMEVVFTDGKLVKTESLATIRERLSK